MNYSQYLQHKYALTYTTYIRRNGTGFYLVDGVEVPEAEFKALHNLPTLLNRSTSNPDKTKMFLA